MKDFRILLNGNCLDTTGGRVMKRIKIGNYELSIQASKYHYCTPKKTLENLFDYKTMEVAIFDEYGWCNLEYDIFFNDWKERKCFLENYDGMVAWHLSIEIIQSLYNYIEDKKIRFAI